MALTRTDTITSDDLTVLFKYGDSDFRAAAMTVLLAYMQDSLTFPGSYAKQYSSPSATGFSVAFSDNEHDQHLILTPVAGYAAGTIVLPLKSTVVDGQRILVNCTQAVTTLTVSGNGATVVGAPTTLTANAFFTMAYDTINSTWYRVG